MENHTDFQKQKLTMSQDHVYVGYVKLYLFSKLCFLSLLNLCNLLQSGSLFCTVTVRAREESEYIKIRKIMSYVPHACELSVKNERNTLLNVNVNDNAVVVKLSYYCMTGIRV